MINANTTIPDMPVLCSLDGQFAEVNHMEGSDIIKLKRDETRDHHYISLSWIVSTDDDKVKIDRFGEDAMQQWSTTVPNN